MNAAATIQAALRGYLARRRVEHWHGGGEWNFDPGDLQGNWIEAWRSYDIEVGNNTTAVHDEMWDIAEAVQTGWHDWDQRYEEEWAWQRYSIKEAMNEPMVKWLLRYKKSWFRVQAPAYLLEVIVDYQRGRLCAVGQVLAAKGVPREVFATHCGGLDIGGWDASKVHE